MINFNKYFKETTIKIQTVGTDADGEGQLIIIDTDLDDKFVILIDSLGSMEQSIKIFKENNITLIDLLIWTHPHTDHSTGLIDLINSDDIEIRKVFVPTYIEKYISDCKDVPVKLYDKIIHECGDRLPGKKSNKIQLDECSGEQIILNEIIKFNPDNGIYDENENPISDFIFEIKSLSPSSQILTYRHLKGKMHNKNDLSISVLLTLGDFRALFSGDIEDNTIKRINEFDFIPNYIKIPHHGSRSSFSIIDKISCLTRDSYIDVGVITNMKSAKLPQQEGKDFYSNYINKLYYPDENISNNSITIQTFEMNLSNREYVLNQNNMCVLSKS